MTKNIKLISILVVLILLFGTLYWFGQSMPQTQTQSGDQATTHQNENQTNNTSISATDTSDAALNKDLSVIDSQMQGLTVDSQNIDKGLNDQPVPQQN